MGPEEEQVTRLLLADDQALIRMGFRMVLEACGGFYAAPPALAAAYRFSSDADTTYWHAAGAADPAAVPDEVPAAVVAGRMVMPKGAKPAKGTEEEGVPYVYDAVNPAQATLAFAARSGIFKGKYTLYYEYELNGVTALKAVKASYAGILAPVRGAAFDDLPAGLGHALVPDSDPAFKASRLKRSHRAWLDAE